MAIKTIKLTSLILLVLLSASAGLYSQQALLIDKVIARVGTETILLSDVEDQYAYQAQRMAAVGEELKCEIMQSLIAQKLIVHQAKLDSVEVSESQLESNLELRIENVLRQMNSDESFF